MKKAAETTGVSTSFLEDILADPFKNKPNAKEAIAISSVLGIPLHPFFTFFWENISLEEFEALRKWLLASETKEDDAVVQEIVGLKDNETKHVLEELCIPHQIIANKIKLVDDEAHALAFSLGLHAPEARIDSSGSVFENIQKFTAIQVRQKAPSFVGARMGRPEKAKRRQMKPLVHALFPVGLAGGSRRNLSEASNKGTIEVDIVRRRCLNCNRFTVRVKCPSCGSETVLEKFCPQCGRNLKEDTCPVCNVSTRSYAKQEVNVRALMSSACRNLGLHTLKLVKGVKGMTNETKTPEILEKGILRAKHDLSVFKDGTIRFDVTNAPLTHFTPKEMGVSVEHLRKNNYLHDHEGNPLTESEQICE